MVGVIRLVPDPAKSLDRLTLVSTMRTAIPVFIRTSLRKSHSARSLFTASAPIKRTPIRTAVYTTAFVLSAGLFAVYYSDPRSALHRYILNPLLRNAFEPETGHKIAVKVLKSGLAPRDFTQDDKMLNCRVRSPANYKNG